MSPNILIIRSADGYRLLHGHLHLANLLNSATNVSIDVPGEGIVIVARTREGVRVSHGDKQYALLQT